MPQAQRSEMLCFVDCKEIETGCLANVYVLERV